MKQLASEYILYLLSNSSFEAYFLLIAKYECKLDECEFACIRPLECTYQIRVSLTLTSLSTNVSKCLAFSNKYTLLSSYSQNSLMTQRFRSQTFHSFSNNREFGGQTVIKIIKKIAKYAFNPQMHECF